jgi:hypothetical protein
LDVQNEPVEMTLSITNERLSPVPVSLDPWNAWQHISPGDTLILTCSLLGDGWLNVHLTGDAVFVNARSRSACVCRLRDAQGPERMETLPAPDERQAIAFTTDGPDRLVTWAGSLKPDEWRAVMGAEVPFEVGGQQILDRNVTPDEAVELLVSTSCPPGSEPELILRPAVAVLRAVTELRLTTH